MPSEVEIVSTRTVPSGQPGRAGKDDLVIFYRVGNALPNYITLPAEGATEANVQAAIKAAISRNDSLTGKKFNL